MVLQYDFYQEIIDKEKTWLINLDYNLLNIYYLPELKSFYQEKLDRLNYECTVKPNKLIKAIAGCIENMVYKLDYFLNENDAGRDINIKELSNFFILNLLQNSICENDEIIKKQPENSIYILWNKIETEDLDDDFYYNEKNS